MGVGYEVVELFAVVRAVVAHVFVGRGADGVERVDTPIGGVVLEEQVFFLRRFGAEKGIVAVAVLELVRHCETSSADQGSGQFHRGDQIVDTATCWLNVFGQFGDTGYVIEFFVGDRPFEAHLVGAHQLAVVGQKEHEGVVPDPQAFKFVDDAAEVGIHFGDHGIVLGQFCTLFRLVMGAVLAIEGVLALEGGFIGEGFLVVAGGEFEIVGEKAVGPGGLGEKGGGRQVGGEGHKEGLVAGLVRLQEFYRLVAGAIVGTQTFGDMHQPHFPGFPVIHRVVVSVDLVAEFAKWHAKVGFAEVGGLVPGVAEDLADGLVFGGEPGLVLMEAVDDHHATFVRVEAGLETGAGRYALTVAGIGLGEMNTRCCETVERRSVGGSVDKPHAACLHLVAEQDENMGAFGHDGLSRGTRLIRMIGGAKQS